jgi:NADPH2:quinone reductase
MRAIEFPEPGGPDVLTLVDRPLPHPGPGQARIRLRYAGVNFLDCYLRSGLYPAPLPGRPGKEGAGLVDAVGDGVDPTLLGRPAAVLDANGTYAEAIAHPADRLLVLPPGITPEVGAAVALQGSTAHYLSRTIHQITRGDRVLVHAAAGGVGLLLVQVAKHFGAEVFATCSSAEKAQRVRSHGADHVLRYDEVDFADEVLHLTAGQGVDVTYDSVGRATLAGSVRATRIRGHLVVYGQSSGMPDPVSIRAFLGSRTLTSATLFDYVRTPEELAARARELFRWIADGWLQVTIDRVLPLAEAAEAHRLLEGRGTSGKLLLAI